MNDYKNLIHRLKLTIENPVAGEAINAIEILKKERDAAVANLQQLSEEESRCDWCLHNKETTCDVFCYCPDCKHKDHCVCRKCAEERQWEWRGVAT